MGALSFPGLDSAIANLEGFGPAGNLATINNNPGDIIASPFATAHGATGTNNGFAVFPDLETGFQAEDSLVGYYANKGATLQDLTNAWAPAAAGNDPITYAQNLAKATGTTPNTPVSALAGAGGGKLSGLDQLFTASDLSKINKLGGMFGFSWQRFAAFVVGLICIAGGIYLLKPSAVTSMAEGTLL